MRVFILFLFISLSIFSEEEGGQINYQSIRQMIRSGKLEAALKETEDLLADNPGDATLALYQAEIWLEKGEKLYQRRKYKSALVEFEKVYKVWNNHAFVRQRYEELKNKKPLLDAADERPLFSPIVPMGLQGGSIPQNKDPELSEKNKTIEKSSDPMRSDEVLLSEMDSKDRLLYRHIIRMENYLIIALTLLGIINISFLFNMSKKK